MNRYTHEFVNRPIKLNVGRFYEPKISELGTYPYWQIRTKEEIEMGDERHVDIETKFDKVSHYAHGREYEPRKVIYDWGLNFNLGNVIKYISRAGRKGESFLDDLRKAKQYLEYEIEECEKKQVD